MRHVIPFSIIVVAVVAQISCSEQGFAIKNVTPSVGAISGNEQVTIHGNGFDTLKGMSVYFGTAKANKVVVSGATEIVVTSPPGGEAGPVDIRVSTDNGQEYLLKNAFRYAEKSGLDIGEIGQRKSLRDPAN